MARKTNQSQGSLWQRLKGPRTQASLFHYVKEEPEPSIWSRLDFSVLRHPIRFLKEEWHTPHTQPSLFHYIVDESAEHHQPFSWKEFFADLVAGSRAPVFIPSVYTDPGAVANEGAALRSKRKRARIFSAVFHLVLVGIFSYLMSKKAEPAVDSKETVVFVGSPMNLPFESTGPNGGGGGGGGKQEKTPPSGGRMAETARTQMVAPDPSDPQPLVPAEDLMQAVATIVMPIDIPQDQSMAIGDVTAPLSDRRSSGGGSGGGIGTGTGTGIGPGSGAGVGPGSGGGMGGGSGGGIGSGVGPYVVGGGVREPELIYRTLPSYTEEARKNRVEGIVLLQVVVRANGSVDNAKIIRGLGFGLDESALKEVVTKWKFKPGTLSGRPVDVQALIEVSFRLL